MADMNYGSRSLFVKCFLEDKKNKNIKERMNAM